MTFSSFRATASAVARFDSGAAAFAGLDDDQLLAAQESISLLQRQLDVIKAWSAAEIARRSGVELGYNGLARRKGFVNAEALLQSVTGATRADASKYVRMGRMMAGLDESPETGVLSWQGVLATSVESGSLSVEAANAIRTGLDGASVPADDVGMVRAVEFLVDSASEVNADQLLRQAREQRDELDAGGIATRERERRELRYFGARRRPDGMVVGSFALADEDGALALAIYEQATGPRSVGPRFIDPDGPVANTSDDDPRTGGQRAADAFIGLLRVGVDADPRFVFGHDRPSVRVLVNVDTLAARTGHGRIEGGTDPISFETIERHLCESGVIGVAFDGDGRCVNVGRDHRLFTKRQRIGLAARDGGCRFPGCERPPSWTEAHHIDYWGRDGGETNIDDGILLCRLHHLLIHNNHWQIRRDGAGYSLIPPPEIDPKQVPRSMPSKQPLVRELTRELAGVSRSRTREPSVAEGFLGAASTPDVDGLERSLTLASV